MKPYDMIYQFHDIRPATGMRMTLQARTDGVLIVVGMSEILISWPAWKALRWDIFLAEPTEETEVSDAAD